MRCGSSRFLLRWALQERLPRPQLGRLPLRWTHSTARALDKRPVSPWNRQQTIYGIYAISLSGLNAAHCPLVLGYKQDTVRVCERPEGPGQPGDRQVWAGVCGAGAASHSSHSAYHLSRVCASSAPPPVQHYPQRWRSGRLTLLRGPACRAVGLAGSLQAGTCGVPDPSACRMQGIVRRGARRAGGVRRRHYRRFARLLDSSLPYPGKGASCPFACTVWHGESSAIRRLRPGARRSVREA